MVANYDVSGLRKALIVVLAKSLRKDSKFYKEDYEAIVKNVNRKTLKELNESLNRQHAINAVTEEEIKRNCQI